MCLKIKKESNDRSNGQTKRKVKLSPPRDLHESIQEEKGINCLELQIFLLHSMFDTEKKGFQCDIVSGIGTYIKGLQLPCKNWKNRKFYMQS